MHLTSIQRLRLNENAICYDGLKALGPHLAKITSIRSLNLSCNEFGPAGADSLGPAHLKVLHLAHLKVLRVLDLSTTQMGLDGIRSLWPHLAALTAIKHLDLSDNGFSLDDAESMKPHMAPLKIHVTAY